MKYIYLSKKAAKNGEACVFGIYDKELENPSKVFSEESCLYIGNDLPHFISYDEKSGKVREATELEKIKRGQLELRENQIIINNQVLSYDKKTQKVIDNKIVDKTREDLIEDKIITLESEREKAREFRAQLFEALDMLDIKVVRKRMTLTEEEEKEIEEWRQLWLDLPEKYKDIKKPIEEIYPATPIKVAYYM